MHYIEKTRFIAAKPAVVCSNYCGRGRDIFQSKLDAATCRSLLWLWYLLRLYMVAIKVFIDFFKKG